MLRNLSLREGVIGIAAVPQQLVLSRQESILIPAGLLDPGDTIVI